MNGIERYSEFGAKSAWVWSFDLNEPGNARWCYVFGVDLYLGRTN
jgi:hypothetical protein